MLTLPSSVAKASPLSFTLNKVAVLAAADDAYWMNSANIKSVIVVYRSSAGNQRKRLEFDFTQAEPIATTTWTGTARSDHDIEQIVLVDFDGDTYSIPSANLPSGKGVSFGGGGTTPPIVAPVVHNYVPNGAINDMVTDGSNVYIGGAFSALRFMASNMTSVNASTAAPQLTSLDGFPQFVYTPSPANTRINAIVFDGPNTIFVAGRFNQMNGEDRRGLAKLIRSGSRWIPDPSWHDGTTNRMTDGNISWGVEVYHISIDGDNLIITGSWGQYKNPDGTVVTGIRRFHVVNKNTGVFQFGYSTTSTANAAGVHKVVGDWIYVAGRIPDLDGSGVSRVFNLARFNRSTGVRDTSFSDPAVTYATGGNINSIFEHSESVFVAGGFTAFGGQTKKSLVKLNASDGVLDAAYSIPTTSTTPLIWDAKPDGSGNVFLCGVFNDATNLGRNIVKLSLADGSRISDFNAGNTAYRAGSASSVRKVTIEGGSVFVFGQFSGQNTTSDPFTVRNVAKLDLTSGALDTGFTSVDYMQDPATEIAQTGLVDGSNLIIGGSFKGYGGYSRQGVAKLTKDADGNWKVVEAFNTSSGGTAVNTLALSGNDLYIGGTFTTWAGAPRLRVAKLNATTGALDPSFGVGVFTSGLTTGQFNGVTNTVLDFAFDTANNEIVIGGEFSTYSKKSSASSTTSPAVPRWIRVNLSTNTEVVPTNGSSHGIHGVHVDGGSYYFTFTRTTAAATWGSESVGNLVKTNNMGIRDTNFATAESYYNYASAIIGDYIFVTTISAAPGIYHKVTGAKIGTITGVGNTSEGDFIEHGDYVYAFVTNGPNGGWWARWNKITQTTDTAWTVRQALCNRGAVIVGNEVIMGGQTTSLGGVSTVIQPREKLLGVITLDKVQKFNI